ncbi:intein/RHS repeat-associated protein [Micromonospora pisi]|uniref:Intein/RHS repeat-associated protein n=1 Tax=Micromonospora pisi TaxID=589240 RepID=A0A495JFV8_9ACTN|nr:DNRLRE domain-containing protein [Micromonospora pisi]RKR87797.1 intein/RHS repeat-associated protein [Micromonospora pisi]
MGKLRGVTAGALLLALVVTLGGVESAPPGGPDPGTGRQTGDSTAAGADAGLLARLREAGRNLVSDGSRSSPALPVAAGLAVDRAAPVGREVKPAKRVRELTTRRSATTRLFEMSDGRVQAEVSTGARFYRNASGRFEPIDTTVRPTGSGGFVNTSNTFTSRFGGRSDDLASFELGGERVRLGLAGASRAVPSRVDGDTVTYPDLVDGADVSYQVTGQALKELITLNRASAAASVTFELDPGRMSVSQRDDQAIEFRDPDSGLLLLVMPAPFMFDARDDAASPYGKAWSDKVTQTLDTSGKVPTVTVAADRAWLADPARVFPVTVDPTIKIQPTVTQSQDAMITSDDPAANFDGNWRLSVGTTTSSLARSLVKFDLGGIPANTTIDSASLQMYFDQDHTTGAYDVPIEARQITAPWTESSVTWDSINASVGAGAATVVTVDDTDTAKTGVSGDWPASANADYTKYGINSTYKYNKNTVAGETFTWVPTLPEAGTYTVDAHYVTGPDRSGAAAYSVQHSGGSTPKAVDQRSPGVADWATLGTFGFTAGTTGRVTLGDAGVSASVGVIADAVRFTRSGAVKKANESSVWHDYPVTNLVQSWVTGTANHGFMLKAADETNLGRGGPRYEAAEYAYNGENENSPKLIINYGKPGVTLESPTKIYSTGPELKWSGYTGSDIVEYQVHRSVFQTFTPSAATLVAPVTKTATTFTDTTATPTPVDAADPFGQVYYYMVAVKTAGGAVIPAPTQIVRLPRAGRVVRLLQGDATDTTLTANESTVGHDVLAGKPWLMVGNNSATYGTARTVVRFPDVSSIPANAQILQADFDLWSPTTPTPANATYEVHALNRPFDEATASWAKADAATNWTTAGGDYNPAVPDTVTGSTDDPAWRTWYVKDIVQGWVGNSVRNDGLLVKLANETSPGERALFLSSEAAEPQLRPKLAVTYIEPTPAQTYYAPETPKQLPPASTQTVPVTVSNPTTSTWRAADWELSYRWARADGIVLTDTSNQLVTPLAKDVAAGEAVNVSAQVKTPPSTTEGNKRTDYVLKWELHNKTTGKWLSDTVPIGSLDQNVAVEEPTSDQLGLEKFYSYAGKNTGAGGTLMNNLYAGNTVWSYNAWNNPSRGLSTFVRLAYNSLDTSDTVAGYGWSLQASSMMRLGAPLDFHPNPNPTRVTLTDGDGTSHWFTWDATAGQWVSPKGVHLYLQRLVTCDNKTEESRAWQLTRPDRTTFFYDCDGFLSAMLDNNLNEMLFTYEERKSNNKPTKFLKYLTDPTGRQTLTIDYFAKGDNYDFINDTTWTRQSATNLTNPHIIDHVKQITDISGRKLTFAYTDKGLLGELVDGAGSTSGAPKVFKFAYDMTQGNKNVKLVKITDPRGNPTSLDYYSPPQDDPKFHWATKTYTDRLGYPTRFAYTDPDGPQGNTVNTVVTDAENHATTYLMDGYGRPTQTTNAKNETTKLGWDNDHNVVRLEEANGAVATWSYDQKTGYPLEVRDAEAVKNGTPGTTLAYQYQLNGYIAEPTSKTSPEGRRSTFTYTPEGDIETVTDPLGNATPTDGDYTTTNAYDESGQLLSVKDANGHTTGYDDFDASGYPRTITDAGTGKSYFVYDVRGNVTEVRNGGNAKVTQTYDTFGRPLTKVEPVDAAAGRFITTPPPVYDANDNMTSVIAPNGAVSTSVYDKADQTIESTAPKDEPNDPERRTTTTYDKVGNVLTVTDPQGNLTSTVGDYTTTTRYDEIYQPVEVFNGKGQRVTSTYDNVGNVLMLVDARKNATADPDDYTTKFEYDLNHRVVKTIDAIGKFTSARYDRDGLTVATVDADGNESLATYDQRGALIESKVPHSKDAAGTITYRTTKYEYDQVGNSTRVTTPRGVATTGDADDFATVNVYDPLNRVKETWSAYDKDDGHYNTADKTFYSYDSVGNLAKVSAPPSEGQTVRNDTIYTYYDNGWTKTSADPWDITNSYDYNDLGQQTKNTLTSAGGSTSRTMTWEYFASGNQKGRSEDGVPVGKDVVLVDNSDSNNTASQGTWTSGAATGQYGYDVHTAAAGTGTGQFNWQLNIPQDGSYEVFVRHPQVTGAATDAKFTITYNGGSAVKTVNQTQNTNVWISLGSYSFVEEGAQKITVTDQATGKVLADAVKLVRNNSGDVDNEKKEFTYRYNPNGLMVEVKDLSPGAKNDRYEIGYDELNQIATVKEFAGTTLKNTTALTYDPNGNPLTSTHDLTWSEIVYDDRDMVAKVTNADSATAGNQQISTFTYTARGQMLKQVKPGGNTVDFEYFLDGATRHQVEKTSAGTTVAEHTLEYSANGHPSKDVLKLMNADNSSDYIDNTYAFSYDPQDRVTRIDKTGDSTAVETYTYDANSNVVAQTVDGSTATNRYDRNRLHSATSSGVTSTYNYDPLGRLDTVSIGGQRAQKYYYDGFDRTAKTTAGTGATAKSTTYVYDPFDRTTSRTVGSKTTAFTYLGMDNQVLREEVAGKATKSYQYAPWGQQLTQIKHKDDSSREYSQFVYRPRGDVEAITKEDGNTRATYGYTAYGKDDESQFTGVDKPGAAAEGEEPYNAFRFNASRWDSGSGTYDMGFRNYDPGLNRFLTRDMYGGAMADMGLGLDPFTGNRYAFAGGNPVSFVELDGHLFGMSWSDIGHTTLDVVGLIPVVGEVADVANGVWYAAEGNYVDAALSMSSAIPFIGYGATAIKAGRTGQKIIEGVDTVKDIEKGVEATTDASKAVPTNTPSTKPDVEAPAGPSCRTNSFVPGTKVVLADGSSTSIEDLKVGDQVLAADVESGDNQGRTVTNVRSNEGTKTLITFTVDVDGRDGSETGSITSTDAHLIWLPDSGSWVKADQLQPGAWLQTAAGTWVQVTAVKRHVHHERVHNLTVDGVHTYYVLADNTPLLVHNCETLNLGSGENPMPGAVNVDISATKPGVDVAADAKALPFKDGAFSEVHAINPFGYNPVSAETARVMQPGALLKVTAAMKANKWGRASAERIAEAGFELVSRGPLDPAHAFGVMKRTDGSPINMDILETIVYRRR